MSNFTYEALLNAGQFSQLNVGTTYASSTTPTDISPGGNVAGQAFTLPASYLQVGHQLRVRAKGIVSTSGTPNLTLGVYFGGVAGTALCATGASAAASSVSNAVWTMEADIRVVSVGTSGSMYALGTVGNVYSTTASLPATSSSGNLVSALDTSVAKILTVGATWGTNSVSNSIQVVQFTVERMNEGSS